MKLIVVDLDRLGYKPDKKRWKRFKKEANTLYSIEAGLWERMLMRINEAKVCTLLAKDFGKKTLMKLPKNDPTCLEAKYDYDNAIFKLKDDDEALKHENKMFRRIFKQITWYRIGVILRRDKAVKILGRLLGIS